QRWRARGIRKSSGRGNGEPGRAISPRGQERNGLGSVAVSSPAALLREMATDLAIGGLVTLGGDRLVALVFAEFEAQYRALLHQQAQAVVATDAGGELGANVLGVVTHLRRVSGLDAEVVDQLVTLHAIADVEDVGVDGAGRADAAFARDLVQ